MQRSFFHRRREIVLALPLIRGGFRAADVLISVTAIDRADRQASTIFRLPLDLNRRVLPVQIGIATPVPPYPSTASQIGYKAIASIRIGKGKIDRREHSGVRIEGRPAEAFQGYGRRRYTVAQELKVSAATSGDRSVDCAISKSPRLRVGRTSADNQPGESFRPARFDHRSIFVTGTHRKQGYERSEYKRHATDRAIGCECSTPTWHWPHQSRRTICETRPTILISSG